MASRDHEFLEYYDRERLQDQLAYYEQRALWHARWDERLIVLTGILMFAAAVSAAVASMGSPPGPKNLWVILATVTPAMSAAVAATRALYEHERSHLRFENTYMDLKYLRANRRPSPRQSDEAFHAGLVQYVNEVEALLSREHRQWVQVIRELKRAEPRQPAPGLPAEP